LNHSNYNKVVTEAGLRDVDQSEVIDNSVDPLLVISEQLNRLRDSGQLYLATRRDEAAYKFKEMLWRIAGKFVRAAVIFALVICSVFILLTGAAEGIAAALEQPKWVGNIICGSVVLLTGLFYFSGRKYQGFRKSFKRTKLNYRQHSLNQAEFNQTEQSNFNAKDELTFIHKRRREALNRIETQISNASKSLEPVFSLSAWSQHHPWLTVGTSATGGSMLAGCFAEKEKTEMSDNKNKERSAKSSAKSLDSFQKEAPMSRFMRHGIDAMAHIIQTSIITYISAKNMTEQQPQNMDQYN